DEPGVDGAVVHRIVFACLLGRIHRLGLEHSGEHGRHAFSIAAIASRAADRQSRISWIGSLGCSSYSSATFELYPCAARTLSNAEVRRSPLPRMVKWTPSLTSFRWTP